MVPIRPVPKYPVTPGRPKKTQLKQRDKINKSVKQTHVRTHARTLARPPSPTPPLSLSLSLSHSLSLSLSLLSFPPSLSFVLKNHITESGYFLTILIHNSRSSCFVTPKTAMFPWNAERSERVEKTSRTEPNSSFNWKTKFSYWWTAMVMSLVKAANQVSKQNVRRVRTNTQRTEGRSTDIHSRLFPAHLNPL